MPSLSYSFHRTHWERRVFFGIPFCRNCKTSKQDPGAGKPCLKVR